MTKPNFLSATGRKTKDRIWRGSTHLTAIGLLCDSSHLTYCFWGSVSLMARMADLCGS